MRLFVIWLFFTSFLHANVYDCFIFFNELELLDVRLHELYDHVDKFVLVESVETFSGNPKSLIFEENKEKFQKFSDKIIHIVLTERIATTNPWTREIFQRQQILRGLINCNQDDIILISDLDEIIKASAISKIVEAIQLNKNEIVGCSQALYRCFLNARDPKPWFGSIGTTFRYLHENNIDLSKARLNHQWTKLYPIIENAGWHFSWMGGHIRVVKKLESYSHQEENVSENKTPDYIRKQLRENNCELVKIDAAYPKYIRDNIDYFKQIGWLYH